MTFKQRFLECVVQNLYGCWGWDGFLQGEGYAALKYSASRNITGAKASYMLNVGPVPAKHQVVQMCNNKQCTKPEHLQLMTHKEKLLRAGAKRRAARTHCKRSHPFVEGSFYVYNNSRYCKLCVRLDQQRLEESVA